MLLFLSAFADPKSGEVTTILDPDSDSQDWVRIPCNAVPPSYRDSFGGLAGEEQYLDVFVGLRRLLEAGAYNEVRDLRHRHFVPPDSLDRLEEATDFSSWPSRLVKKSQVKGKDRLVYRSPAGFARMSIAETVEDSSPSAEKRK